MLIIIDIMTYASITQNIYNDNKKTYKKAKSRICWVIFAACFCLALLNFLGYIISVPLSKIIPYVEEVMPLTTFDLLLSMGMYIFCLVFPFAIAMIPCKTKIRSIFPIKARLTKNPIGYTLFVFGICILFNLFMNLLFPWYRDIFVAEPEIYESTTDIILYFISAAVLPAIFEELVFRGICISCLRPVGTKFAVIVSAAIFGLAHVDPLQSMFAFLFGLLIGGAFVATGSIWPGVLLHFFNNSVSVISGYGHDAVLYFYGLLIMGAMAYSLVYLYKFSKLPGRFPILVKNERESLLTGSSFTPIRALFSNVWTYFFIILYFAAVMIRFFPETLSYILLAVSSLFGASVK